MSIYIDDIFAALIAFPFVALLITVPFAMVQYRKLGSIPWLRTLVVYTFVFYLMCAYFLVLFPLPDDRSIVVPGAEVPHLIPFGSFSDLIPIFQSDMSFGEKVWAAITDSCIYQYLFNILLLLPLGAYLRYYFNCSVLKATLIGLAVSFSFEFLQFTGLLGLYEHPYRFADVDDLIANTLGAFLGAIICQKVMRVLPDIKKADAKARHNALRASTTRRAFSLIIDLTVVEIVIPIIITIASFVTGTTEEIIENEPFWAVINTVVNPATLLIGFVVVPFLTKGQTLGQLITRIYTARLDGSRAPWYLCAARYALLWAFTFGPIYVASSILHAVLSSPEDSALIQALQENEYVVFFLIIGLLVIWIGIIVARIFRAWRRGTSWVTLYGIITHTRVLSTLAENATDDATVTEPKELETSEAVTE